MSTTLNGKVPMSTVKERLREKRALEMPRTIEAVLARPIEEATAPDRTARTEQARDLDRPQPLPTRNVRAFIDALRDEEIEWGGLGDRYVMLPAVLVRSNGMVALNTESLKALGIPTQEPKGYPVRAGLMAHGTIMVIEPVADPEPWTPRLNKARDFQPGIDLLDRAWQHGRYVAIVDEERRRLLVRREDWSEATSGRRPQKPRRQDEQAKPGPKGPRTSRTGVELRGDS